MGLPPNHRCADHHQHKYFFLPLSSISRLQRWTPWWIQKGTQNSGFLYFFWGDWFFCSFVSILGFEKRSSYIGQADLEPTMQPELASNSWFSFLGLLRSRVYATPCSMYRLRHGLKETVDVLTRNETCLEAPSCPPLSPLPCDGWSWLLTGVHLEPPWEHTSGFISIFESSFKEG